MDADLPDDLNLLVALDVFLRERHITRAAKRLGVTQSAASQRLGRLRDHFGDALLAPGRPLLSLTPRAQALVDPLASALASLRSAVRASAPFDPATAERRFVLLGSDVLEAVAAPYLAPLLAREAPRLTVVFERAETDLMARLERGTADLAFLPELLLVPSLRRLALPVDRFVVMMRAEHPLARGKLTLARYLEAQHVLVAPRGMPGSLVDDRLAKLDKKRRVVMQLQHFTSLPFILAGSELVVTCPGMVAGLGAALGLVHRPPPLELPADRVFAVWHERLDDDPAHRWLRQRLVVERAALGAKRGAP